MTYERAFVEGTLDATDFYLARALHKSVSEVGEMPMLEFVMWRAFSVWEQAKAELDGR